MGFFIIINSSAFGPENEAVSKKQFPANKLI
jgi:hypothetical protein